MGHEGAGLMNGINALLKEAPESSLAPSTMLVYNESLLSGEGPHLTKLVLRPRTSSLQNCEQPTTVHKPPSVVLGYSSLDGRDSGEGFSRKREQLWDPDTAG